MQIDDGGVTAGTTGSHFWFYLYFPFYFCFDYLGLYNDIILGKIMYGESVGYIYMLIIVYVCCVGLLFVYLCCIGTLWV